MAFGSGSTTVPSTRIASSLGFASALTTSSRGKRATSERTAAETGSERAERARSRPVRLHQVEGANNSGRLFGLYCRLRLRLHLRSRLFTGSGPLRLRLRTRDGTERLR